VGIHAAAYAYAIPYTYVDTHGKAHAKAYTYREPPRPWVERWATMSEPVWQWCTGRGVSRDYREHAWGTAGKRRERRE